MKKWFIVGAVGGFLSSFWVIANWILGLFLALWISAYFAEILYSKDENRGKGYGPWLTALLGYLAGSALWYFWDRWR